MIREAKGQIEDKIPVQNVIISVYDKTGVEEFVAGMAEVCEHLYIYSTGGTYTVIENVLFSLAKKSKVCPVELEDIGHYTGMPEMEGGLVKTLHPKIHAGILAERNNPEHEKYLKETLGGAEYIDMVVVNLYPFKKIVAEDAVPFEKARGFIDIGGSTMLRAAAKNFLSCAAICRPNDYAAVMQHMRDNNGCTTFEMRRTLVEKVFEMTSKYDKAILGYFAQRSMDQTVMDEYQFSDCVTNKLGL